MYASLPVNEFSHATAWSPLLENDDIDGLIIVGVVLDGSVIDGRIPNNIPVVLVDASAPENMYDVVLTDNFKGAYEAVKYLIDQGHTQIGLVGSSAGPEHPSIAERRRGYLTALSDHGIEETYIEDSFLNWSSAYTATAKLIERSPEITAIFACNDDVAQHVIRALNDSGRSVPEDVSVVGFDDKLIELDVQPPLTTIRVEKELMGVLAVRQLYERAMNLDRPPIMTIIGTRLIVRDSTIQPCSGQE